MADARYGDVVVLVVVSGDDVAVADAVSVGTMEGDVGPALSVAT